MFSADKCLKSGENPGMCVSHMISKISDEERLLHSKVLILVTLLLLLIWGQAAEERSNSPVDEDGEVASKDQTEPKKRQYAPGMNVSFGARAFLNMKNQKTLKTVKRLKKKEAEKTASPKPQPENLTEKKKKKKGLESFVPMSNDAEEEDTPPMSKKKRYFEENEPEGEGSGKKLTSKQ
ncbi:hypothetical protein BSL78_10464, partial [Apostichopus japonicus]